jgi:hypothetical protein
VTDRSTITPPKKNAANKTLKNKVYYKPAEQMLKLSLWPTLFPKLLDYHSCNLGTRQMQETNCMVYLSLPLPRLEIRLKKLAQ